GRMNFLECTDVRDFLAANRDDGTQLWVFQHLARTGGSALSTALGWRLHPNYNVHIPIERFAEENFDSDPAMELAFRHFWEMQRTTPLRFVSGHLLRPHVGGLRKLPHARIFTIFRDPPQQILSLYRYLRSPASPEGPGFARRYPNFDSFIEDPKLQNRI